jgi:hypothetical protein
MNHANSGADAGEKVDTRAATKYGHDLSSLLFLPLYLALSPFSAAKNLWAVEEEPRN